MAVSSGVRNQEPLIEGSAKMAFRTGISGASVSREAEWVKPGLWSLPLRSGLDESLSSAVLSPWVYHGNDVTILQRYTEAVGRRSSKWCRQDTHY